MQYTDSELNRLHAELEDILKEIIRVCDILDIHYFIQGGTAIGAFFNKGFVPWDDDIDLGMLRPDYERFIKEAPAILSDKYFLQHFSTENLTPFYFVKVRKSGTLFVEEPYKDMKIHQGIFVDVFPYDNVPDSTGMEVIHRRAVQYFEGAFKRRQMASAIRESIGNLPRGVALPIFFLWRGLICLFPRKLFYKLLTYAQGAFNKKQCKYVSIVKMPLDQIAYNSVNPPVLMEFEGISVLAPADVEVYLRHHYPHLSPTLPKEKQVNHAPYILFFSLEQ